MAQAKRKYKIMGFDSTTLIYERTLPLHFLSEHQMEQLLIRLAARHLSPDEIVQASFKKNIKGRRNDFDFRLTASDRYGVATIGNPYYMVCTVPDDQVE